MRPGEIVLFQFLQTDLARGKLRPALLLGRFPGPFEDWLLCMISSQLHHEVAGFDEVVRSGDADFRLSGLKVESLLRVGRLAVVDAAIFEGTIGEIAASRLARIRQALCAWLGQGDALSR